MEILASVSIWLKTELTSFYREIGLMNGIMTCKMAAWLFRWF